MKKLLVFAALSVALMACQKDVVDADVAVSQTDSIEIPADVTPAAAVTETAAQ